MECEIEEGEVYCTRTKVRKGFLKGKNIAEASEGGYIKIETNGGNSKSNVVC